MKCQTQESAKRVVHGQRARVRRLSAKLAALEAHQADGTLPKVVFGGKRLWRRVCKGRASPEEWRNARQNRLYARGDETKGGNPNLKLAYRDGEFTLSATISHLSEQTGTDREGRPVMARAPRVAGKLWLPEKHRLKVWELLLNGAPYSVELSRGQGGRYRAHIIFTIPEPYWKIIEAVLRKAFKEGVGVKSVWPAHTSTIGYWKYMQRYGITVHHAAALVIARRAR